MEHRNIHFCAFMFKFYMKAQNIHLHVFSLLLMFSCISSIYMETCIFCAFMFKFYMKAQKHACFHVLIPFSAPFTPITS